MNYKLTILLASAQSNGLDGIKEYFPTDGEFLIKINQFRHHGLYKILPFLQIIHCDITDHKDTGLTLVRIIKFHSLAWK